jgi:EAL domain-containing protein (putative c-di-GMP-specific phosphodiesterase class I)
VPVSQLVEYFNDRIRAEQIRYLPEDPLRIRNGVGVEGRFGAIRFQSVFQPRVAMSSGTPHVAGHATSLRASGGGNTGLDADKVIPVRDVFAAARDGKAVVHLDRLCRLVHTLNYLRQTGETGSLFLHVHARHVAGVATEHGRDFEQVLERCGLQPDRVVIVYTPSGNEDEDSLARIRHALQGYRYRGYSVLLNTDGAFSMHQTLKYAWMLLPNYVQIDAGRMTAGSPSYPSSILHELGTPIVVSKVRTAIEAQRALARGADLLAGEYYGRASSEVRFSVNMRQTVECGGNRDFKRSFSPRGTVLPGW